MATAVPSYNPLVAGGVLPITLDTVNNRVGINNTAPGAALSIGDEVTASSLTVSRQLAIGTTAEGSFATIRLGQSTTVGVNFYYTASATAGSRRLDIDSASFAVPIYMAGKNLFLQHNPSSGSKAVVIGTTALDTDGTSRVRVLSTYDGITSAAGTKWDGVSLLASTLTLYGGVQVTNATGLNHMNIEAGTLTSASVTTVDIAATLRVGGAMTAAGSVTITQPLTFWVDSGASRFDGNMGFFSTAPVAQQTSGANLTNSITSGGTDDTITNWTNLSTYSTDAAAIRNAVYQLARKLKQVNDGLRTYGLLT